MRPSTPVAIRLLIATVAALLISVPGPTSQPAIAQEKPAPEVALAPRGTLRKLERLTGKIARRGHGEVVAGVLDVLTSLGHEDRAISKARDAADRLLSKARGEKDASKEADALRELAGELTAHLTLLDDARKPRLAAAIVRLDRDLPAAQTVLGNRLIAGSWIDKEQVAAFEQRGRIREAVQTARQMPVEIETGVSNLPILQTLHGKKGRFVRWKRIGLHSVTLSETRLRRILENAVRASAVSNYVRTGKLEPPNLRKPREIVLLTSETDYRAAVDDAAANGGLAENRVAAVRQSASIYWDNRGFLIIRAFFEPAFQAATTRNLFWSQLWVRTGFGKEDLQAPLHKGHLNWLCHEFVGARVPNWGVVKVAETTRGGRTAERVDRRVEREEFLKLAKSGLAGIRSYMRYLVERGEDPAFVSTIYPDPADLAGEELLKATLVVEYLQELGTFGELLAATRKKPPTAETFEKAFGTTLAEFDSRWRAWVLAEGGSESLVERLLRGRRDTTRPDALARLDEIRTAAVPATPPVGLDDGLTAGCRLHALYLVKHPDQQSNWPECHEEFTDREGFTPQGAFAGGASVIATRIQSGTAAVDAWLGTFYHRLPLLDPGLLRVGWALEGAVAVLDVGAMVAPTEDPMHVVWPPDGAKDVPLRFNPEMPNPVPAVDQRNLGYPVTVQFFGKHDTPSDITLELFEGAGTDGSAVAAFVSTPAVPTNPIIAPRDAFCLLPKSHLKASTTYTVRATGMPSTTESEGVEAPTTKTWTFRTAAK